MIRNKTVFLLGAGASFHYGYPTGEGLIEKVVEMAERLSIYCDHRLKSGQVVQMIPKYVEGLYDSASGVTAASEAWQIVSTQCKGLIRAIQTVRPLVIDYFLAWNPLIRPIGKLLIAAVLLECEAKSLLKKHHRDTGDWYRFLVHKLVSGCTESGDIFNNNVHFVTFNYDVSLEHHLLYALASIEMFKEADVRKFLSEDRIIHVYGSINAPVADDDDDLAELSNTAERLGGEFAKPLIHEAEFGGRKKFLDRALVASETLRTIDPTEKILDDDAINKATSWIGDASVVYILGYGFDDNNNQRLGLNESLRLTQPGGKVVMFTNYHNRNTINKKASNLFFGGHSSAFLEHSIQGSPQSQYYAEKSILDVYGALEMDFDPLEDMPIGL